jgi:hypothetical protein
MTGPSASRWIIASQAPLTGHVTDAGTLVWDDSGKVRQALDALKGQRVRVVIKSAKPPRSGKSNRFYFAAVVRYLAEEWGYADPAELHDALGHKFRPLPPDPITGAPRRMRTRDMDQEQFSAFVKDVATWAQTDMGINLEGVDL